MIVDAQGLVLTNHHVVRDATELLVVLDDQTEFKAEVVGKDERSDLAVIRIKRGSSPLVDLEGRVIGINTAIASRSGGSQGVGFAIPSDMARAVMQQLVTRGHVERGFLGIFIADLSDELGKSFGYSGKGGVLVHDVSAGSPGEQAGLSPGDVIVEFDGNAADTAAKFRNAVAAKAPGSSVALTVFREGKRLTLQATLGALPGELPGQPGPPGAADARRGLVLSDPTPELKQRYGLEQAEGAVVTRVEPGSAAEEAGLLPGDLVVQVGKADVRSARDADQALKAATPSAPVRLRVLREGRGLYVLLEPAG